jgi:hypothetical protein
MYGALNFFITSTRWNPLETIFIPLRTNTQCRAKPLPIMLSSSTAWCAANLEEQELRNRHLWAGFTIAWVIGMVAKGCCLKSKMAESPKFALIYFLFFGPLLLIGSFVCLMFGLRSCPTGCECSGRAPAFDYFFPIIWAFESGIWLGKVEAFPHASVERSSCGQDYNLDTETTIP